MYETHWQDLLRSSWERESDLQRYRRAILLYSISLPDRRQANHKGYRAKRKGAAARELHHNQGLRLLLSPTAIALMDEACSHYSNIPSSRRRTLHYISLFAELEEEICRSIFFSKMRPGVASTATVSPIARHLRLFRLEVGEAVSVFYEEKSCIFATPLDPSYGYPVRTSVATASTTFWVGQVGQV